MSSNTLRILNALTAKRAQIVGMRKRLLARAKTRARQAVPAGLEAMDDELTALFTAQIQALERRIAEVIAENAAAARMIVAPCAASGPSPMVAGTCCSGQPWSPRTTTQISRPSQAAYEATENLTRWSSSPSRDILS
jgi:transposase